MKYSRSRWHHADRHLLRALPYCAEFQTTASLCLAVRPREQRDSSAHHSAVVLRAHDPPVFTTSPKPERSEDVLFAHGRKLKIDRCPILEHGVAAEKFGIKGHAAAVRKDARCLCFSRGRTRHSAWVPQGTRGLWWRVKNVVKFEKTKHKDVETMKCTQQHGRRVCKRCAYIWCCRTTPVRSPLGLEPGAEFFPSPW